MDTPVILTTEALMYLQRLVLLLIQNRVGMQVVMPLVDDVLFAFEWAEIL